MGSKRLGAAPHALRCANIWDAPVDAARRRRAWRPIDAVFLALPDTLVGRSRAGARRARHEGVRSLRRVPAARRRSCGSAGIRIRRSVDLPVAYGLTERHRAELRRRTAGRVRRVLSDRGGARAAAAGRGRPARARDHHRREVRRVRRRQDADRAHAFLASATAASRRTACSRTGTRAEIEQELGAPVTFVPHLVPLDRGILETIYARLPPGVGRGGGRRGAAGGVRRVAVRPADREPTCRRSSTSRTRTSATSAGGSMRPAVSS